MIDALVVVAWIAWTASWTMHERRMRRRYAESKLARFGSESIS